MRVRNGIWIALSLLLALTAAYLLYETRRTTLWFDEWLWALDRRGSGAATFLDPHNGHLSLVPVVIYKLLFATAGLTDYAPYRVVIVVGPPRLRGARVRLPPAARRRSRRRAGRRADPAPRPGLAEHHLALPDRIGDLAGRGIGALLALDARTRAGDLAACGLLALALASSGLGVIVAIGVVVDLLWNRRRPRDLWIVAGPAVPYALWWLVYQDTDFVRHNLVLAPGFAADAAAGACAALTGLSGVTTSDTGASLPWGRPLAVAAAAVLVWRLWTMERVPGRAITLLAMAGAFWLLTAIQRADQSSPDSSRYLYVGGVLVVLVVAELARGVALSARALAILAAVVGLATLANLGDLRDASRLLREQAAIARADLAALELARATVPARLHRHGVSGLPLPRHPCRLVLRRCARARVAGVLPRRARARTRVRARHRRRRARRHPRRGPGGRCRERTHRHVAGGRRVRRWNRLRLRRVRPVPPGRRARRRRGPGAAAHAAERRRPPEDGERARDRLGPPLRR